MIDYSDNKRALLTVKYVNSTNRNIFLTGRAGTGKTTLLKHLIQNTHKQTIVAAPTGIAAINAGGTTLHSLFHLPFGAFIPDTLVTQNNTITTGLSTPASLIKNLKMNTQKRNLIRSLELLVIDEVSMLRADMLDAIDTVLRHVRRNTIPFGGVQLLFIGDLLQLPPVVKNEEFQYLNPYYPNVFFFNALALKGSPPVYIELEKIFRQTDPAFINVLNNFRNNQATRSDFELLNMCYDPNFEVDNSEGYIQLTTHNHKADSLNQVALQKLGGKEYIYRSEVSGDFKENSYPLDTTLVLKEGAQVMFVKNDYSGEQRYFNGKIGTVKFLTKEDIEIEFNDGTSTTVEPYTWENKRYKLNQQTQEVEEKVIGTFVHYPIKLAWAITIHKSQGLTFDKAIIDVSQAFAAGQIYVALSRLTSLKGLKLTNPINTDVPDINSALFSFAKLKKDNVQLENELENASVEYVAGQSIEAFNFDPLLWHLQNHIKTYNKDKSKSAKQKYLDWAQVYTKSFYPIIEVSGKFQNQLTNMARQTSKQKLSEIYDRMEAAQNYFKPLFDNLLDDIDKHIEQVKRETGVRKYLTELDEIAGLIMHQIEIIAKTKKMINAVILNTEIDAKSLNIIKTKPKGKEKKEKKKKVEKTPSAEITFESYKQGKSVKEIATERNLAVSTVESHLGHFVAKGELDVNEFVSKEKIEHIIEVAKELDTMKLGPIKEYLGGSYSYSEVRFGVSALIYNRFLKGESIEE